LLENVDALSSLTSVEGFVMIDSNTVLENLDGFGAVTSIGENLSITRNPALSQLRGLHNVGSLSSGLSITNNAALPACEAELLRDSIGVANIAGMIEIEENTGTGDCATP
jgi:hypothetical protein